MIFYNCLLLCFIIFARYTFILQTGVITTENHAYVLRPLNHLSADEELHQSLNVSKIDGAHVLMKVKQSSDYCGGDYKGKIHNKI